uniref:Intercellular adhesion molecule N-terminal domain-containing protein n=1 Tax=Anas zonorhyncha TaxID=75864 RepID=A0A8B9U8R4_9AVES
GSMFGSGVLGLRLGSQVLPRVAVVPFGDSVAINCSHSGCSDPNTTLGLETSLTKNATEGGSSWQKFVLVNVSEWNPQPALCYATCGERCTAPATVLVYRVPERVVLEPVSPAAVGESRNLTCRVAEAAPLANLTVTLRRGGETLCTRNFGAARRAVPGCLIKFIFSCPDAVGTAPFPSDPGGRDWRGEHFSGVPPPSPLQGRAGCSEHGPILPASSSLSLKCKLFIWHIPARRRRWPRCVRPPPAAVSIKLDAEVAKKPTTPAPPKKKSNPTPLPWGQHHDTHPGLGVPVSPVLLGTPQTHAKCGAKTRWCAKRPCVAEGTSPSLRWG